jgi:transposase-like protein
VDETYVRVKGKWVYLYRAVDSSGATIDFLLSAKRDAAAAERFLAKALGAENHPAPRVINTDKHAGYPPVIVQLKSEGALEENCQHRPVQYLNKVLEQDHRAINRRIRASQQPQRPSVRKCGGHRVRFAAPVRSWYVWNRYLIHLVIAPTCPSISKLQHYPITRIL